MGYKSVEIYSSELQRFSPPGGFIILNHSVRTNELCHVKEDNLVRITKTNIANNALRGEKSE